ncbi:hypothetical protein Ahia01_001379500 [Argonauta hians]
MTENLETVPNLSWNCFDADQNYQICDADSTLELSTENNSLIKDQGITDTTTTTTTATTTASATASATTLLKNFQMIPGFNDLPQCRDQPPYTQATNLPLLPIDDYYPSQPALPSQNQQNSSDLFPCDTTYISDDIRSVDKRTTFDKQYNVYSNQCVQSYGTNRQQGNYEELNQYSILSRTTDINPISIQNYLDFNNPSRMCFNPSYTSGCIPSGNFLQQNIECSASFDDFGKNIPNYEPIDRNSKHKTADSTLRRPLKPQNHDNINGIPAYYESNILPYDSHIEETTMRFNLNNDQTSFQSEQTQLAHLGNGMNVTEFKENYRDFYTEQTSGMIGTDNRSCHFTNPMQPMRTTDQKQEYFYNKGEDCMPDYYSLCGNGNAENLYIEDSSDLLPIHDNTPSPSSNTSYTSLYSSSSSSSSSSCSPLPAPVVMTSSPAPPSAPAAPAAPAAPSAAPPAAPSAAPAQSLEKCEEETAAFPTPVPTVSSVLPDCKGKKNNKNSKSKAKPFRQPYLPFQLELLERYYKKEQFCSLEIRAKLVKRTGLTDKQVRIWFQNRRAKSKKRKNSPQQSFSIGNPAAYQNWLSSQKYDDEDKDDVGGGDDDDNGDDDNDNSKACSEISSEFPVFFNKLFNGLPLPHPSQFCPVHRNQNLSQRSPQFSGINVHS